MVPLPILSDPQNEAAFSLAAKWFPMLSDPQNEAVISLAAKWFLSSFHARFEGSV